MKENISAIIIDLTTEQRNKLKLLLTHIEFYDTILMAETLRDARRNIEEHGQDIDVVFVTCEFDRDHISDFIEDCQKLPCTECAVFILLLAPHAGENRVANVAEAFMVGAHACLSQPYSVDNVREVTEHALKLRTRLKEARSRTAIKCLLQAAVKHIDNVSQRIFLKTSPMQDLAKLREVGRSIAKLDEGLHALYFEMLVDTFERAELPFYLPGIQNYTGPSKAAQRRAAKKREALSQGGGEAKGKEKAPAVELPDGRVTPPKR